MQCCDFVALRLSTAAGDKRAVPVTSSTALVLYQPHEDDDGRGGRPHPRRRRVESGDVRVHVTLHLRTRPSLPHERADGQGAIDARQISHIDASDMVSVALRDGSRLSVSAHHLATHSDVLARHPAICRGADEPQWLETEGGVIRLADHSPGAVRGVLAWMAAEGAVAKRAAAGALLSSAEHVVDVARLCHYINVQPLLQAALSTIEAHIDVENAPSCLLLARELEAVAIEKVASAFIVKELEEVCASAPGWEELPRSLRELLSALDGAVTCHPLVAHVECGDDFGGDARELLAATRESLLGQVERLDEARLRQRQQRLALSDAPETEASGYAERVIEAQARRVRALATYLHRQEDIFARLLEPDKPRHTGVALGAFAPLYEWQPLPDGAEVSVPPGLEVELPLDGRPRRARIPPRWQLRVWIGDDHGFWRMDVARDTTVAEIAASAALCGGASRARLWLGLDELLEAGRTVEELALFSRVHELSVELQHDCCS